MSDTYTDIVHNALQSARGPITAAALFEQFDEIEDRTAVSKSLSHLVKTGRAEVVDTIQPPKSKPVRRYRALTDADKIERTPSDIDAELAEALKAQPEPDASIPLMPRDLATFDSGEPVIRAIDRLDIQPRIQGAANDSKVLYRLADKIARIGNNPAADIAARLCEIAAKLEAAA